MQPDERGKALGAMRDGSRANVDDLEHGDGAWKKLVVEVQILMRVCWA